MTDYTITTDFGAKDSLPSGNAAKVIKGSEFTTEFTNIKTAVNSKADTAGDTFTGAVTFDAAVTLNADVTFDTNTMFVDVSENRVGIGNVAPATALDVTGVITTDGLTSSAGIDVTGTVTADGLTVDTNTLHVDATNDRVGIGTTSPAYELDVTGSAQLSGGDLILRGDSTDADTQSIRFENASDDTRSAYIRADYGTNSSGNATSLVFGTNPSTDDGSDRMVIDNTGKVGIGTNSPLKDLNVSNTTGSSEIMISTSDTGTGSLEFGDATSGAVARGFLKYNHTDNSLQLGSAQTERMRIDSSGKVGIGTSSPARLLDVQKSTIGDVASFRGSDAARELVITSSTTTSTGDTYTLNANSGNGVIAIATASTERMRIDASGKVGIGTSSPDTLLEVVGADPILTIRDSETSSGATNATLRLAESGGGDTLGNYWDIKHNPNAELSVLAGSTERMRIDSTGNVGIGTNNPTFDSGYSGLHISQTAPSIHLTPTSSGTTASDGYAINVNSSGIVRHINKENQPIEFHTNNTERMRIDSSGNVLVGTTSQFTGGSEASTTVTVDGSVGRKGNRFDNFDNVWSSEDAVIIEGVSSFNPSNSPNAENWYFVKAVSTNTGSSNIYCTQTATTLTGKIFTRYNNDVADSGTWTSWVEK